MNKYGFCLLTFNANLSLNIWLRIKCGVLNISLLKKLWKFQSWNSKFNKRISTNFTYQLDNFISTPRVKIFVRRFKHEALPFSKIFPANVSLRLYTHTHTHTHSGWNSFFFSGKRLYIHKSFWIIKFKRLRFYSPPHNSHPHIWRRNV